MTPAEELDSFIDKYSPEIAEHGRAVLGRMRAILPNAVEMVYDNYNALVCGFGPSEKTSDAIFSIAFYPRYVTLFFLQGAGMPDPYNLLEGAGKLVRSIRLTHAEDLDRPEIRETIEIAIDCAKVPFDPSRPCRLVIKSISPNQRPRII